MNVKLKIICACLLCVFCSCKKDLGSVKSYISKKSLSVEPKDLNFNKSIFKNRAEELMYIREYLKQELPKKLLREQPKRIRDAQYYYIVKGKDYTLNETAVRIADTIKATEMLMFTIMKKQYSLNTVKKLLKQTGFEGRDYVSEFDPENRSIANSNVTVYNKEEEFLIKNNPKAQRNFSKYHEEQYISIDKTIKLTCKIEHISIAGEPVEDSNEVYGADEFTHGQVQGMFFITGSHYTLNGHYAGEGNYEGVIYDNDGSIYGLLYWSVDDNGIFINLKNKQNTKDYDLIRVDKKDKL